MERIKNKKTFKLKDSEVIVLQLTKELFVLRDWFSYNISNLTFEDVVARFALAEKNQEEFPDVFWELINA